MAKKARALAPSRAPRRAWRTRSKALVAGMKHAVKHIHFVGIGGSGMSGIAEILLNLGYTVSGSDIARQRHDAAPCRLGIRVAMGHDAAHIAGADAVVRSTAVQATTPRSSPRARGACRSCRAR